MNESLFTEEITYRCFDLEMGGFLPQNAEAFPINDLHTLYYQRIELSKESNARFSHIKSSFSIRVYYYDTLIVDYYVDPINMQNVVNYLDYNKAFIFLSILESFRKEKFLNINN